MGVPDFVILNDGWNADPNVPHERVEIDGASVRLTFAADTFRLQRQNRSRHSLLFENVSRWVMHDLNDEGWYLDQCRYGRSAPDWGLFYEIVGEDKDALGAFEWNVIQPGTPVQRHFLFYLRDSTFECFADDWTLEA